MDGPIIIKIIYNILFRNFVKCSKIQILFDSETELGFDFVDQFNFP
jgi:hypothetical protein